MAVVANQAVNVDTSADTKVDRLTMPPPRLQSMEGDRRDLVLRVLKTLPSQRDARSYLRKFSNNETRDSQRSLLDSILNPLHRHTALIKVEYPLGEHQAEIARTLVSLQKLGLLPVVVVDSPGSRQQVTDTVLSLVDAIDSAGGRARPILNAIFENGAVEMACLRSAFRSFQIPVVLPISLDDFRHGLITPNEAMTALSKALAANTEAAPVRIMLINERGGIPSTEREGRSHVFINLASEHEGISQNASEQIQRDLQLMKDCLSWLPDTSSGVIVPHSASTNLVSNLITDKPPISPSVPSAQDAQTTVLRSGMSISLHTDRDTLDQTKLTRLLERSFGRTLIEDEFYTRLKSHLHIAIIAGDYDGAAILTKESSSSAGVIYLDKFAVNPDRQGEGVADILWSEMIQRELSRSVSSRTSSQSNAIVWRSRADNAVNKWYFERADGHWRILNTQWVMFWVGGGGHGDTLAEWRHIVASIGPVWR